MKITNIITENEKQLDPKMVSQIKGYIEQDITEKDIGNLSPDDFHEILAWRETIYDDILAEFLGEMPYEEMRLYDMWLDEYLDDLVDTIQDVIIDQHRDYAIDDMAGGM